MGKKSRQKGLRQKRLGTLTVWNGTGRDAAVKLVREVNPTRGKRAVYVRYVYVCSGDTLTLREIPRGRYVLMFALGADWDEATNRFQVDPHAFQFAEPVDFQEIHGDGGVTYSTFDVTLHKVPEGKAPVVPIDSEIFERNDPEEFTIPLKSF